MFKDNKKSILAEKRTVLLAKLSELRVTKKCLI